MKKLCLAFVLCLVLLAGCRTALRITGLSTPVGTVEDVVLDTEADGHAAEVPE